MEAEAILEDVGEAGVEVITKAGGVEVLATIEGEEEEQATTMAVMLDTEAEEGEVVSVLEVPEEIVVHKEEEVSASHQLTAWLPWQIFLV